MNVNIFQGNNSNAVPVIELPDDLPKQELKNPNLVKVTQDLYEANGVLQINNLFPKSLIAQLNATFSKQYQSYFEDKEDVDSLEVGDRRKILTVDIEPPFNNSELYANPLLLKLMQGMLGKDCVLGSFGTVIALPGAEHQHLHYDHTMLFNDDDIELTLPSFAITLVIPLVDLTQETGSTRVWKGSHKMLRSTKFKEEDSYVPYMSTGSCYLMDYKLYHGGTPNRSKIVRPILYAIYYRPWFYEAINYEKQARISITVPEYKNVPPQYRFLFARAKEQLGIKEDLAAELDKGKPFEKLTVSGQGKCLEKIAMLALKEYGLESAYLRLINHGDNTTFRVDLPNDDHLKNPDSPYRPNRFLLRVHRGNYLSPQAIESELRWLEALCSKTDNQETSFFAPEPVPTLDGSFSTVLEHADVPEARVCSLTRWVKGKASPKQLSKRDIKASGQLMAQLHNHGQTWTPSPEFTRPIWNWDGLFGTGTGQSTNGQVVWELTPQPYRQLFEQLSQKAKGVMAELGEDREQFGLIHGDLCLGNILFADKLVKPIDFADCGFGYWGYDIAGFMSSFAGHEKFEACLQLLLEGYESVRPFPAAQRPHLPLFIAIRHASVALWKVNRTQDHPHFRAIALDSLEDAAEEVQTFLNQ